MLYIENETKFEFNDTIIQKIAKEYTTKDIELLIIDNDEMRELNKNSREIDSSTDVLSFPLEPLEHIPLGSIVINANRVINTSKELNHSKDAELTLMFIHGLLHLLGYDHEIDDGEMREKEEEIINKFNLPKSLILRTKEEA